MKGRKERHTAWRHRRELVLPPIGIDRLHKPDGDEERPSVLEP